MRGENIVCFSKDWSEAHTSNHHVLLELARHNRVLWIDSVGTRSPDWSSARDRSRILRKVASFSRGPHLEREELWRTTPLALPFPKSATARAVNRRIVARTIRSATRKLGMETYQLWTFLPTTGDFLDDPRATVRVYYCVDEWGLFRGLDAATIAAQEARVCHRVDVVFATAEALVREKRRLHPNVLFAPHGVDQALFARALDDRLPLPSDLLAIPEPRIGFHGTLDDWFDAAAVAELAVRRPEWSFVLIGPERVAMTQLRELRNVHLLGVRKHDELPRYAAGFAVGCVPYRNIERMRYVSPLKVREYLAAGLPVVTSPLSGMDSLEGVRVARDTAAFEEAIERALAFDSRERRRARSAAMRGETWEARVERIGAAVLEARDRRWTREEGSGQRV